MAEAKRKRANKLEMEGMDLSNVVTGSIYSFFSFFSLKKSFCLPTPPTAVEVGLPAVKFPSVDWHMRLRFDVL